MTTSRLVVMNPVTETPFSELNARVGTTTLIAGQIANARTLTGAVTAKGPAAPAVKDAFAVVDIDGNADVNPITIDGNGTTIDGAATATMDHPFGAAVFCFDGDQWRRLLERRTFDGSGLPLELACDAVGLTSAAVAAAIAAAVAAGVVLAVAQAAAAYAPAVQATTDATVTRIQRSPVADGDDIELRYIVKVHSTDGSGAVQASWLVSAGYKRIAGTLTAAYAATISSLFSVGAATGGPTLTLNGNTDVDLNVTGIAATNLTWSISEFVL